MTFDSSQNLFSIFDRLIPKYWLTDPILGSQPEMIPEGIRNVAL